MLPLSDERAKEYKNPDNDPRGRWASVDLTGQTGHATENQYYTITTPSGRSLSPPTGRCWALAEATFLKLNEDSRIWFGKKGNSRPRLKKFLSETEGSTAWTWWTNTEVGHNQEATKELLEIMGESVFDNPKPTRLIKRILQLAADKDSLILDSFAGSGTTGNAVLQLNREDGGNRRFVLVELDSQICSGTTNERLKRIINGYTSEAENGNQKSVTGLGGGFRYCTLDEPLFDERGQIHDAVRFVELARHIFFTETGEPLSHDIDADSPLIGEANGTAYYLLWAGRDTPSILDSEALNNLPKYNGMRVVYADGCKLAVDKLRRSGIVFKQIPYEVKVS